MTGDLGLNVAAIERDATARVGFEGWDPADTREALTTLVESIEGEAGLHAAGRRAAGERLRALLAGYVGVQRDGHDHPEILVVDVGAPIVVLGLPRSGTTLLHALIGADPAHRTPVWWESLRPSPPPAPASYADDPRRREVQAIFDDMFDRSPTLLSALPYAPDLVAECNTVAQPCLRTVAFTAAWHIPSYQDWYVEAGQGAMYSYHRRALQQFQWRMSPQRWVLKAPAHIFTSDQLLAEYPDATLIEIHRDPVKTMGSGADLYLANRILHADAVDPAAVARDYVQFWARGNERMEAFRAAHPEVRIIDVLYQDLVRHPHEVLGRLYDEIGLELTDGASAAMQAWLDANARSKRPEHRYDVEQLGIGVGELDERFGAYCERYGIPLERDTQLRRPSEAT